MRLFGPRYPQWGKHQIVKQQNDQTNPAWRLMPQFVCELCEQSWLSADTVSRRCPGLPVYWRAYLVTATELEVLGMEKPKSMLPVAYLKAELYPAGTEWTPLYDQREIE